MNIPTKVSLVSVLALLIAAPAMAQPPATDGDYYASTKTIVQQPTSAQTKQVEEGDYYAPVPTIVQQPTAQEFRQVQEGDYYPPTKGN
jgi:hypothetical protein